MTLNPFHKTPVEKVQHSFLDIIKDKEKRHHVISVVSIIFLFFSIFVGIFIGLLQKQEIRKSASNGSHMAEMVLVPSSSPLRAETLSTIFIRLNTKGQDIDGIQVSFDLLTNVTDEVSVQVKEGNGLRWAWDKVEGMEGGKRISFAAITNDPYNPFSSNSPVDVAEISFVANRPGNLVMVFDGFTTKVNKHQQLGSILKPIIIQEYRVAIAPTPVPIPIVTVKESEETSIDSADTKGGVQEDFNFVTADVSVVQIADVGQGVCNDDCQVSLDCKNDFLCYNGSCRLATNVTSSRCADIIGGSKGCNQDCTQTIECETGLSCFEGSCRSPVNPQSVVCQNDKTITDTIDNLCGTTCAVNDDCGDTLSCASGECRLAINPSSPNCSDEEVVVRVEEIIYDNNNILPPIVPQDSEESLSLLTQVVIALALTVVIGIAGGIAYAYIKKKRNSIQL